MSKELEVVAWLISIQDGAHKGHSFITNIAADIENYYESWYFVFPLIRAGDAQARIRELEEKLKNVENAARFAGATRCKKCGYWTSHQGLKFHTCGEKA